MFTNCKGRMLLELLSISFGLSNLTSETIYSDLQKPSLILLRRFVNVCIVTLSYLMFLKVFLGVLLYCLYEFITNKWSPRAHFVRQRFKM